MKKQFPLSVIIILTAILSLTGQNSKPIYLDTSIDFETRALNLVSQMTLDEKISQLGNDAPAIPRLGIKAYDWWNEALHGVARAGEATMFPQAIGMAASFDLDMMSKVANIISDEARAKYHDALKNNHEGKRYYGLTFWSPNINIFRDPRWGRGHETYGEDPFLTGQMGVRFVKGLQGNDGKYLKLVATAKHYAVHNGPEADRHYFNVNPDMRDLWETYLPAFEDLVVEGQVESVMGAYNRVFGASASASQLLLEDILREKWGFNGYVVSDCGAIRDIHAFHKIVNKPQESAALGISTGCDLNCGRVYQTSLKKAVKQGLISEKEIDQSLFRLMLARMKLGMFDPEETVPFANIPFTINNSPEHDLASLEMAHKSMTLLKNDGILPLDKEKYKNIVIIGPNSDRIESLRGNYFGKASNPATVLQGLKNKVGSSANIEFIDEVPMVWQNNASEVFHLSEPAIQKIKDADIVIFAGGLDATWEGEEMGGRTMIKGFYKGDRTKIELPKAQLDALQSIINTKTPVVFVLMAGSSIAFNDLENNFNALLMAWYPGQRGGDAVADVLFGDYNPAGRLPVTFYRNTNELGDFADYNMRAGKGFTYRFYTGNALYPFGYGLSYTTFEYRDLDINKRKAATNETIKVTLKLKNTGKVTGEEVVQLYIRNKETLRWTPIKELKGFKRISLLAGEEKTIEFTLNPEKDFRYFEVQDNDYRVESGRYEIMIGTSSEDIRLQSEIEIHEQ